MENNITQNNSKFDDYFLQEYSIISEAHFKTIENISAFFKNYLLLMTIPITLIVSVFGMRGQKEIQSFVEAFTQIAGWILIIISLIGCAVFLYVVNLRLDAILYARTINGIRKYFYENSAYNITFINRFRILPQSLYMPPYYEGYYFIPVLLSFAIFNGSYLLFGLTILSPTLPQNYCLPIISTRIIGVVSLIILHFLLYYYYARHREYGYLKSNIIGIDIDGVLNKHRDQFCDFYNRNKGSEILDPKDIDHIPVHENEKLNVTKDEEECIFNDPMYWIKMPPEKDIQSVLRKLKNAFKFKLFIFTYRPWPVNSNFGSKDYSNLLNTWEKCLQEYELSFIKDSRFKPLLRKYFYFKNIFFNIIDFRKNKIINRITKTWLKSNGATYDKLIVEKGNEHVTDRRGDFNNRLIIGREKRIKYFVEDDLEKAIKLSFICDYVFLIKHPYNNSIDKIVPKNIIAVNSWNEIYKNIREL